MDAKRVANNINNWLEDYRVITDCKGVVLGLSGGKDSTVVAMLAKKQWGDDVFAIIMPNGNQADIDDAIEIAETLNIDYRIVNIETVFNNLLFNIETVVRKSDITGEKDWFENCPKISDKAKTNIPPRLRMTILYAVAQTLGYRVIGTGNASERYIGWFTKYGDGGCDLNPIAHLTCSEVVELGTYLAQEFNLSDIFIKKVPADGLTGKSDEDNFGFTYKQLDAFIREGDSGDETLNKKMKKMHNMSEHKLRVPVTYTDTWFLNRRD